MKSSKLILPALVIMGGTLWATADQNPLIQTMKVAKPVQVKMPAMTGDSTNFQGKKFSLSSLLDTKSPRDIKDSSLSLVEMDSDGLVLPLPENESEIFMNMAQTELRAERFAKGNIEVITDVPFQVYINGEAAGKDKKTPITLEPEETYKILVKTMVKGLESDTLPAPKLKVSFVPDDEYSDVAYHSAPDMKRRFMLDDTQFSNRVRNVRISPDGKYMVVAYTDAYDHERSKRYSVVKEIATGKVLNSNLAEKVNWMPTGSTLYYTQKSKDGYDLFTISLPEMKHQLLIPDLPTNDIDLSPKGDFCIYVEEDNKDVPKGPLRRYTAPDDRIPTYRNHSATMKYDIATGIAQPLLYGETNTMPVSISPDGKKLLYMSQEDKASEYPFYFIDLVELDLTTLATDTILKRDPFFQSAYYSPKGDKLFIMAGPLFQDNLGSTLPKDVTPNNFDIQGYILDIKSKNITPVTKDFDPNITSMICWNRADNNIYIVAEEGFDQNIYSINPVNGKITKVPTEIQYTYSASMGNDESEWIAYWGGGDYALGEGWLYNLKTKKSRLIDNPSKDFLDGINLATTTPWTFTASDGTVIDGRCTLPPDFDPEKKYPLIVYYYGGTSPSTCRNDHPYSPQLFASRDYVVYVINPSGTTGYGQEFSSRHVNAWGKRTAEDIIEGVEAFCEAHPFVDKKKIGCLGASYGGFMTQFLQTKTDLFAAAVSHAGISNVTSYWGEGYWGYSYNSVAAAQSYPWSQPELFTKQGSLFNADKIHTPLLLLHGTADTNVPIGESIQLFNALKILGRDVEFISVDGENHFISDYPKRELWHATIMAWFAKYLQDDPRWWDSMYK